MLPYSDSKPKPRREQTRELAEAEKQRGFGDPINAMIYGPMGGLVGGAIMAFAGPTLGASPIVCLLGAMGFGIGLGATLVFKALPFRIMSAIMPGTIGILLANFALSGRMDLGSMFMSFIVPAAFVGMLAGATKRNMTGILVGFFAGPFGSVVAYGGLLLLDRMRMPVQLVIVGTGVVYGALVALTLAVALKNVKQTLAEPEPIA